MRTSIITSSQNSYRPIRDMLMQISNIDMYVNNNYLKSIDVFAVVLIRFVVEYKYSIYVDVWIYEKKSINFYKTIGLFYIPNSIVIWYKPINSSRQFLSGNLLHNTQLSCLFFFTFPIYTRGVCGILFRIRLSIYFAFDYLQLVGTCVSIVRGIFIPNISSIHV